MLDTLAGNKCFSMFDLKSGYWQNEIFYFTGRFDDSVIEERRQSALQLLQFAASYPPLFTSQVFVKFFEDGYKIENSEYKKKTEEKTEVNILQPSRCLQKSDVPLSSFSGSKTKSLETNCKESNNSLGGTWQHHQVPDNISLGSHCTDDDDDHTTFTDDDSIISRPSFNLFEFDPLLESKDDGSEQAKSPLTVDNVCNNWLLSALESCSTSNTEKDIEGMLEFPTPFDDFENIDEALTPSNKSTSSFNLNSGSGNNQHFTFDSPVSASVETCDVMEFDPLVSQQNIIKEAENDVCNSDEFAMTPDAYKGEAAHRPSYIIYASKYVLHAQEAEESGKYPEAFDSYKKAIDVLLQGIKKEPCPDLSDAVRKKVYLYLMRAEEIYENKLPKSVNSTESK
ncbi:ribosomal protein S6 kinase delta-1-like, partial [Stegodyphus dumicola]|uniref:ribosomal protein S6 kinase delta-1-like n=1 Tax=Stegodyphus dumicola TaxID=202533 RepID=UPI0015B31447